LSEISVAVHSSAHHTPHLAAGNLIGGSLVIYLFVIPMLAFWGGGIALRHTLGARALLTGLAVTVLPAWVAAGGVVTPLIGGVLVAAYGFFFYLLFYPTLIHFSSRERSRGWISAKVLREGVRITVAGIGIFYISKLLVSSGLALAEAFHLPVSLVGLLALSLGTNAPELTIAMRSILSRRKAIAFGNYVGSAAANTLVFGLVALFNGRFTLERGEFVITAILFSVGLVFLYRFCRSRSALSRTEGAVLMVFYAVFIVWQLILASMAV
jgi:Ca2+/Na+ antiporter